MRPRPCDADLDRLAGAARQRQPPPPAQEHLTWDGTNRTKQTLGDQPAWDRAFRGRDEAERVGAAPGGRVRAARCAATAAPSGLSVTCSPACSRAGASWGEELGWL